MRPTVLLVCFLLEVVLCQSSKWHLTCLKLNIVLTVLNAAEKSLSASRKKYRINEKDCVAKVSDEKHL